MSGMDVAVGDSRSEWKTGHRAAGRGGRRPPAPTPQDAASATPGAFSEETVTSMDDDPFSPWGLRPVELADAQPLGRYFASLANPLSDYTFPQLYTWRNSLRILWKEIRGHLCVFANGTG